MPLQSKVIEPLRLLVTRAIGALRLSDLQEHRKALLADPGFDPGFNHLFDLREVERIAFSSEDVVQATLVRAFSESSRRAIVAPQDVSFGLSRMYELHREDHSESIRIFRDLDQALQWLGLDPGDPLLAPIPKS